MNTYTVRVTDSKCRTHIVMSGLDYQRAVRIARETLVSGKHFGGNSIACVKTINEKTGSVREFRTK